MRGYRFDCFKGQDGCASISGLQSRNGGFLYGIVSGIFSRCGRGYLGRFSQICY